MSASEEEVESFLRGGTSLVSGLIGSGSGAALGLAIGGPPGAIIGALSGSFITDSLKKLTGEMIGRQLGDRQSTRAAAGLILLERAIKELLSRGETLQEGEFSNADESGRRPIDELTEQAILAMINSVEEHRIPYLANFYAALYFDERISRASIPTLSAIAGGLNYRAMCILNLIGRKVFYNREFGDDKLPDPWDDVDHIVAKETFTLLSESILLSKAADEDHYSVFSGYQEINPCSIIMSNIGDIIYIKMKLENIQSKDSSLMETEQSFINICKKSTTDYGPDYVSTYEAAKLQNNSFLRGFA